MGNLKVIRTLFHHANIVVTDLEDQEREREHVKSEQELQKHVYEKEKICSCWNRLHEISKQNRCCQSVCNRRCFNKNEQVFSGCGTFRGTSTRFKPHQTVNQLLVYFLSHPRTKQNLEDQTGFVVYRIPCMGRLTKFILVKLTSADHIEEHPAKIANNFAALAEHYQSNRHKPN